jgi:signal transduction histidine kinase
LPAQRIILVEGGGAQAESVRAALEAEGYAVERVGSPEDAVELAHRERLVHAHRVETLSALAGGIAHDVNNALASALMAIGLLAGGTPAPALLAALEESLRRAMGAVRQLSWLARDAGGAVMLFQPKHLLAELQRLASALLPPGSELMTAYPYDLRLISADPREVFELLLGLLRTGRTALPPAGGTLTLSAENADLFRAIAAAQPGSYVVFDISPAPPGGPPESLRALLQALGGTVVTSASGSGLRAYVPAVAAVAAAESTAAGRKLDGPDSPG